MIETMTLTKYNTIPKHPRYGLTRSMVAETLLKYADNKIPINLTNIIKCFNNIELRCYSWYQRVMQVDKNYIIEKLTKSEDGGLLKISDDLGNEEYMILYENLKPLGRKRFTIAHELGHYLLKHHQLIENTVISRGELSDNEYDVLEKEANYFARMLLVPLPLIIYIAKKWGPISEEHLMDIFKISHAVSFNVISHIIKLQRRGFLLINESIVDKYKNSLNRFININICNNCHSEFVFDNPSYCPICGSNKIIHIKSINYFPYLEYERSNYMIYSGIEVNENSKAIVCPVCGNEEPSEGEYCPICGEYLVNRCTNHACPKGENQDGFGAFLPGNARYCTYCGCPSTFLTNKLLVPWQVEKQELEANEYKAEAALSFEINDDDIPF